MDNIKYLEEQLSKIDKFRYESIQLVSEFRGGKWHCYYGWMEYDGLYPLDFLSRDGGTLESVARALARDVRKYIAEIDRFTSKYRLYCPGVDSPDGVIIALLAERGIETYEVTDIQMETYGRVGWRMGGRKHAGQRRDVMERFWVKK